ncbi:MAG: acyltransferase family protein [Acidimicrobiales bacterium]
MGVVAEPGRAPVSATVAVATTETLDQAGTAPGDRRFRPDVEGLRAVAILLVVLYHADLPGLGGGYVGVDVFFVISGFVITGVLLRERSAKGRTSLAHFYARRVRRILPAATLVIVTTVIATYVVLGPGFGNATAVDSRWAELFLANFHFAASGTNYLNAHQPPSPLQNFWSLAIEEQFYLVYPTLFLVVCSFRMRWSRRARLLVGLGAVVVASFVLSVVQTSSAPAAAYFSPFTRAWELALGALVAVATDRLVRLPRRVAGAMTWVGLAAILFAALDFGANTTYPGALVAVPVLGAALVIAGGTAVPVFGAEVLLGRAPFGWLGRLSYSLYLWHWPILVLAAESADRQSLPFDRNLLPLALAVAVSVLTFYLYETPIRHLPLLQARSRYALVMGAVLVVVALGISTVELDLHNGATASSGGTAVGKLVIGTPAQVAAAVADAPRIQQLPTDLLPPLTGRSGDWGGSGPPCFPSLAATTIPAICVAGIPYGSRTMVLYGDSHAAMWQDAFGLIATFEGWRLYDFGKGYCEVADVPIPTPPGFGRPGSSFTACDSFRRFAVDRINALHPDLVVITEEVGTKPDGRAYTPGQWKQGLERTIRSIHVPRADIVVLGNVPVMKLDPPQCLEEHTDEVQACSNPLSRSVVTYNSAEAAAAAVTGVRYVNAIPWFCSTTCTAVIGRFQVYFDSYHIDAAYSTYLGEVVTKALGITEAPKAVPPPKPGSRSSPPAHGSGAG